VKSTIPSARSPSGAEIQHGTGDLTEWRTRLAPLFEVEELSTPFMGQMTVYRLGELRLMEIAAGGQRLTRNSIARSDLAESMLVLTCASGSAAVMVDGRSILLEAGDITCLDLAQAFSITADNLKAYGLLVPRRLLFAMPRDAPLHGRVLPAGLARARALGAHCEMLAATCPTVDAPDNDVFGMLTAALLEATFIDRAPVKPNVRELGWSRFGEISRYIEANLGDSSLSVEHLCDKFGTSRATLYRMFEHSGGVASFIRDLRLSFADQALSVQQSPQERMSALAARLGFKSEDTFSRAYRERYGLAPRQRRNAALVRPDKKPFTG
jgi:AraC-like DNA-binding protein